MPCRWTEVALRWPNGAGAGQPVDLANHRIPSQYGHDGGAGSDAVVAEDLGPGEAGQDRHEGPLHGHLVVVVPARRAARAGRSAGWPAGPGTAPGSGSPQDGPALRACVVGRVAQRHDETRAAQQAKLQQFPTGESWLRHRRLAGQVSLHSRSLSAARPVSQSCAGRSALAMARSGHPVGLVQRRSSIWWECPRLLGCSMKRNRFVSSTFIRRAPMTPTEAHAVRPRIEGDREREILEATLEVLADVGYDRLTMDAVATRARASKATLYRRWNTKVGLVIDALLSRRRRRGRPTPAAARRPDRGVLRHGRPPDGESVAHFSSVLTAIDPRRGVRRGVPQRVIGPKVAVCPRRSTSAPRLAARSGRTSTSTCFGPPSPASCLHRVYLLGRAARPRSSITRVIDQIILPAAPRAGHKRPRRKPMSDQPRPGPRSELPEQQAAPGVGARAHLGRPADGGARRHHRQHRAALHRPDLDISQANLSWIVTGYALAFGGLLLLGGRLGDLYGRRRIFMIGLTIFAIASLLGGLATRRGPAARRPWPPGPRRRARLPRRPGADHHDVPGRPAAQPRVRGVRRDVRCRRGRRPDPRWLADRPRRHRRPRHRAAGG